MFCANKAKNLVKEFRLKELDKHKKEDIEAKLCAEKEVVYIFNLIADAAKEGCDTFTFEFKSNYKSLNYKKCYAWYIANMLLNNKYCVNYDSPYDKIQINWRDD